MVQTQRTRRRAVVDTSACVACGCCEKICPKHAVSIRHGMYAAVSPEGCVGCGICVRACPASIIRLEVCA